MRRLYWLNAHTALVIDARMPRHTAYHSAHTTVTSLQYICLAIYTTTLWVNTLLTVFFLPQTNTKRPVIVTNVIRTIICIHLDVPNWKFAGKIMQNNMHYLCYKLNWYLFNICIYYLHVNLSVIAYICVIIIYCLLNVLFCQSKIQINW